MPNVLNLKLLSLYNLRVYTLDIYEKKLLDYYRVLNGSFLPEEIKKF